MDIELSIHHCKVEKTHYFALASFILGVVSGVAYYNQCQILNNFIRGTSRQIKQCIIKFIPLYSIQGVRNYKYTTKQNNKTLRNFSLGEPGPPRPQERCIIHYNHTTRAYYMHPDAWYTHSENMAGTINQHKNTLGCTVYLIIRRPVQETTSELGQSPSCVVTKCKRPKTNLTLNGLLSEI